jgi:hypothetical protein
MNLWKASTFALTLALGAVVGTSSINMTSAEPQPNMKLALVRLREARHGLVVAAHDHGGHRTRAVQLTEGAIMEVEDGIAWAATHDKK